MRPSSEDVGLVVYEIVALVMNADLSAACMLEMNVYVLDAQSSGFTLDDVDPIKLDDVKPLHLQMAQVKNKKNKQKNT